MSLKIRLSRGGAKKRPYYHIVVADSRSPRDGRFIERIGSYNPLLPRSDEKRIVIKEDRAKHWLSNGALPTERVAQFFGQAGLGDMPAQRQQTKKHLPKAKAQERMKEAEEAKKAAAEAAKKAAEEAASAPAEEPAAEEAPAEAAPAEETPAQETAAEESAAEETPAEDTTEGAAG